MLRHSQLFRTPLPRANPKPGQWDCYKQGPYLSITPLGGRSSLLGRSVVPWGDVTDYSVQRDGQRFAYVIKGRRTTIRFATDVIDREELEDEIQRRAESAAIRKWELRGRTFLGKTTLVARKHAPGNGSSNTTDDSRDWFRTS